MAKLLGENSDKRGSKRPLLIAAHAVSIMASKSPQGESHLLLCVYRVQKNGVLVVHMRLPWYSASSCSHRIVVYTLAVLLFRKGRERYI